MNTMKESFKKAGLKESNPQQQTQKGKSYTPEEGYRQNIIKAFGNNYQELLLTNGGDNFNGYVDKVKKYVADNKNNITTSQLRNIFSKVKSLSKPQEAWKLRPNLAYVAGRSDKFGTKEIV